MDNLNKKYPLFETLSTGEEVPTYPSIFSEDADPDLLSKAKASKAVAKRSITTICNHMEADSKRITSALKADPEAIIAKAWIKESQEELAQRKKQLDKALIVLSQNLIRLAIMQGKDIEDESQFKEFSDQEDEYIQKAQKAIMLKSAALSQLIDKDQSSHAATATASTPGANAPSHNPESRFLITHLRPAQNLNLSMQQPDVKKWKVQFSNYFLEANLQKVSISAQEAHAESCIDSDLWRRIKFLSGEQKLLNPALAFTVNPESDTANCLFNFIDNIFSEVNPILNRRLELFNLRQKLNEPLDHNVAKFQEACDNANIDKMDTEDWGVCLLYNFIIDPDLKKELFKIPPKDRKRTRLRQEMAKWNHLQAQLRSQDSANINYVSSSSSYPINFKLCCACGSEKAENSLQFCGPCYRNGPSKLRCSARGCPKPNRNHDTSGHKAAFAGNPTGANWSTWYDRKPRSSNWKSPDRRSPSRGRQGRPPTPSNHTSASPRRKGNASPTPYSKKFGQRQRRPSVNSVSDLDACSADDEARIPDLDKRPDYTESDFCGYITDHPPTCNVISEYTKTETCNTASRIDEVLDNMIIQARAPGTVRPFQPVPTCPDSGCSRNIIGLSLARKLGLHLVKSSTSVCGANSLPLANDGATEIQIKYHATCIKVPALVSSSVDNRLLLSRQALIDLNVLPKNFPFPLPQ